MKDDDLGTKTITKKMEEGSRLWLLFFYYSLEIR